jgi:hypothetical protein
MKLPVAFLGLALVTSALQAQTLPAPAAKPAAPTTPAVKVDPKAKPDAKAKMDDKKKKDEMGVIKGTTINRANGTFLGLEVVSGNWVLSFYDKKKKPVAMDVTRATARWPNVRGPGDNRTVLNGSGTKLVGSRTVLPPYTFNVYITLLKGEGDDAQAVETVVVQYRG